MALQITQPHAPAGVPATTLHDALKSTDAQVGDLHKALVRRKRVREGESATTLDYTEKARSQYRTR